MRQPNDDEDLGFETTLRSLDSRARVTSREPPRRKRAITQQEWQSLGVLAAEASRNAEKAGNEIACDYYKQLAEKCDYFVETTPRLKAVS